MVRTSDVQEAARRAGTAAEEAVAKVLKSYIGKSLVFQAWDKVARAVGGYTQERVLSLLDEPSSGGICPRCPECNKALVVGETCSH